MDAVSKTVDLAKEQPQKQLRALVIGGGIAGIQAALDLADARIPVTIVEKSPSLGGRMAQLDKTFPTMDCAI
jgi:heterodisulfide reductase subunit A